MEKFVCTARETEGERDRLPLSPLAFGSGTKFPEEGDGAYLLLTVRDGECQIRTEDGEEELATGGMLFAAPGHFPEAEHCSGGFLCDFVLFSAEEHFLDHLDLPALAPGEVGEGGGISAVVKMSPYSLEYYHDRLKICATVYTCLAKLARDRMIAGLERFDKLAERLSPAMLQIEQRYMETLTVRMLAHSCSMSESAFTRLFKRLHGCTPTQYLIRVRIDAAKELLATTDRSFEDIAVSCGFSGAKYFGDMLKKIEHVTPRELRALYQGMTQIKFF